MKELVLTHPEFTFEPMGFGPEEQKDVLALDNPKLYSPALSMTKPPTQDIIDQELKLKTLQLWRMRDAKGTERAVVFFNEWTSIASTYVFVRPDGLFEPSLCSAALEALITAIFAADKDCKDVLTQVLRPEHRDAEETLAVLGFETLGTLPAYEVHQRSYWLKRHIWDAYRGS